MWGTLRNSSTMNPHVPDIQLHRLSALPHFGLLWGSQPSTAYPTCVSYFTVNVSMCISDSAIIVPNTLNSFSVPPSAQLRLCFSPTVSKMSLYLLVHIKIQIWAPHCLWLIPFLNLFLSLSLLPLPHLFFLLMPFSYPRSWEICFFFLWVCFSHFERSY